MSLSSFCHMLSTLTPNAVYQQMEDSPIRQPHLLTCKKISPRERVTVIIVLIADEEFEDYSGSEFICPKTRSDSPYSSYSDLFSSQHCYQSKRSAKNGPDTTCEAMEKLEFGFGAHSAVEAQA